MTFFSDCLVDFKHSVTKPAILECRSLRKCLYEEDDNSRMGTSVSELQGLKEINIWYNTGYNLLCSPKIYLV